MVIGKKDTPVRIKKISTNFRYYIFVPDGFEKTGKLISSIEKGYNIVVNIIEEEKKELTLMFAGLVLKISQTENGLYTVETETETETFEVEELRN